MKVFKCLYFVMIFGVTFFTQTLTCRDTFIAASIETKPEHYCEEWYHRSYGEEPDVIPIPLAPPPGHIGVKLPCYIATATNMFHLPSCHFATYSPNGVTQWFAHASREDLIAHGYEPCKYCDP